MSDPSADTSGTLLYAALSQKNLSNLLETNNVDALEIMSGESITLSSKQLQVLLDMAYQRGINRELYDSHYRAE